VFVARGIHPAARGLLLFFSEMLRPVGQKYFHPLFTFKKTSIITFKKKLEIFVQFFCMFPFSYWIFIGCARALEWLSPCNAMKLKGVGFKC